MKNFAAVNASGKIVYTASPATDDTHSSGDLTPDGLVLVEFGLDTSHSDFAEKHYYNFLTSSWVSLPPKPSPFHIWQSGSWVPDIEGTSAKRKHWRDTLLRRCDWTQLSDVVRTDAQAWVDYRQALRDVPSQVGFPFDIIWPISPLGSTDGEVTPFL